MMNRAIDGFKREINLVLSVSPDSVIRWIYLSQSPVRLYFHLIFAPEGVSWCRSGSKLVERGEGLELNLFCRNGGMGFGIAKNAVEQLNTFWNYCRWLLFGIKNRTRNIMYNEYLKIENKKMRNVILKYKIKGIGNSLSSIFWIFHQKIF